MILLFCLFLTNEAQPTAQYVFTGYGVLQGTEHGNASFHPRAGFQDPLLYMTICVLSFGNCQLGTLSRASVMSYSRGCRSCWPW